VDDFETYNLGSLDLNDPMGTNQGMNGDLNGNPWFGPEVFGGPNCMVVGPENGIVPISGNQMIRGQGLTPADFDQDWFNLAYRLNGGQPFFGGIILSWYFYDVNGAGDTNFRDYVALAFYDTAPSNTDAPIFGNQYDYDLNHNLNQIQRLSLGAPTPNPIDGLDPNYYQARVPGAIDGFNTNGYFNTPIPRTPGWHKGAILVGPQQGDGTNVVFFFIDDVLALMHTSSTTFGFNIIEVNANFGTQTGYFDLISFEEFSLGD
jgi:hypothetical protein